MCPWLSLYTVTFKKLASVSLPSVKNLMFLWKEFKAFLAIISKKNCISFSEDRLSLYKRSLFGKVPV